ncbi:MAG TPA: hypothetical protein VFF30_09205 [Nitrososphaerales archaeon]|nr:hypothetical protein [Nitrososphaerales archaeon]
MVKKTLLSSLILVVAGLALLVYADPQFRLIFAGGSTLGSGFPTTRFSFNSTFPRSFNGTFVPRGSLGSRAAALGFNAASIIESLIGVGLVGVGIVFLVIEMFMTTRSA